MLLALCIKFEKWKLHLHLLLTREKCVSNANIKWGKIKPCGILRKNITLVFVSCSFVSTWLFLFLKSYGIWWNLNLLRFRSHEIPCQVVTNGFESLNRINYENEQDFENFQSFIKFYLVMRISSGMVSQAFSFSNNVIHLWNLRYYFFWWANENDIWNCLCTKVHFRN